MAAHAHQRECPPLPSPPPGADANAVHQQQQQQQQQQPPNTPTCARGEDLPRNKGYACATFLAAAGRCSLGERCPYRHVGRDEWQALPTQACKFHGTAKRCRRDACVFFHGDPSDLERVRAMAESGAPASQPGYGELWGLDAVSGEAVYRPAAFMEQRTPPEATPPKRLSPAGGVGIPRRLSPPQAMVANSTVAPRGGANYVELVGPGAGAGAAFALPPSMFKNAAPMPPQSSNVAGFQTPLVPQPQQQQQQTQAIQVPGALLGSTAAPQGHLLPPPSVPMMSTGTASGNQMVFLPDPSAAGAQPTTIVGPDGAPLVVMLTPVQLMPHAQCQ